MDLLLSFDIEEFDMPLEYAGTIAFEDQLAVSRTGTIAILDLLKKHGLRATFFSTVVFAEHNKDLIFRLILEGHELASHTWYHSKFSLEDLKNSREWLSTEFNVPVSGLRMPRMMAVDAHAVQAAGYIYNSSVNPTWLPGRYNNFHISRTFFIENGVFQLPASVSPGVRVPLFWLSFHNFPQKMYRFLAKSAAMKDGYLNIYFHPWEFSSIKNTDYKLPGFTVKNSGSEMISRFESFLIWTKKQKMRSITIQDFVNEKS